MTLLLDGLTGNISLKNARFMSGALRDGFPIPMGARPSVEQTTKDNVQGPNATTYKQSAEIDVRH